jgi:hypothetical protein
MDEFPYFLFPSGSRELGRRRNIAGAYILHTLVTCERMILLGYHSVPSYEDGGPGLHPRLNIDQVDGNFPPYDDDHQGTPSPKFSLYQSGY